MSKPMTKSQVEDAIAKKANVPKKTVHEVLAQMADLAYEEAKNSFTVPGIGKLVLVNRQARQGRNPRTGETIEIPAKQVVKFRIAKAAKDAILKK